MLAKKALRAFAVIACCTISVPSLAAVVFSNAPNQVTAFTSDRNTTSFDLAQSFVLTQATSLTDAHWWGTCQQASGAVGCSGPDSFNVSILADAGGLPGALVAQLLSGGSANRVPTGNLIAGFAPEFEYSIAFAPVALSAGTRYWLEVSNFTNPSAWLWETSNFNPTFPSAFMNSGTGGNWVPFTGVTFAMALTNDAFAVPEPLSAALVVLAIAALAASRRKRHA